MGVQRALVSWSNEAEDEDIFVLCGEITEEANLTALASEINRPVTLDLEHISRVNSSGVREWLQFVSLIDAFGPHHFRRCPPVMVHTFNMFCGSTGQAEIESVMAPMYCDTCRVEELHPVAIIGNSPRLPALTCEQCAKTMRLGEDKDAFFFFLTPEEADPLSSN